MEALKVEKWLTIEDGSGYGGGDGFGSGNGDSYGYGFGFGSGLGSGFDSGNGYGYGSGDGDGDDAGRGYGYGRGDSLKVLNDMRIFMVDGVQTIITSIKGNLAKGYILNNDLTLQPCFVVKNNRYFAHGETVDEAREALQAKIFENMDTDEAIDKFLDTFKPNESYIAKDFYEWHHYLTGSCEMGRKSFMKNHEINFDDSMTVEEFIAVCENDFGSDIIKQLKERWNNK